MTTPHPSPLHVPVLDAVTQPKGPVLGVWAPGLLGSFDLGTVARQAVQAFIVPLAAQDLLLLGCLPGPCFLGRRKETGCCSHL